MHILFLAQRVPYPPNRGDRIATYHEIRLLSKKHHVHVAALSESEEEALGSGFLREICASVDVSILPHWRSKTQALAMGAAPLPLTLPYFFSLELATKVAFRMATEHIDLVHVFSSSMAQYVDWYRHLPRVMEFADLDSIKWRQMATMNSWPKKWVYAAEATRLLWYERSIARRYQKCLVVTEEERQELLNFIPYADAEVAANGVDVDYFRPQNVEPEGDNMVFVGVMDYFPNEEGMEFFCKDVLPIIQRDRPAARITIVGSRPSARVLDLGNRAGVTVTGAVEDIRPYMAQASLAVVPLRLARGVQNKVLEAMSMGLPTVCSSAAFRGIEATEGEHALVADDPVVIAELILGLLRDPALRHTLGEEARKIMVERYSWEARVARLEAIHEEVVRQFRRD